MMFLYIAIHLLFAIYFFMALKGKKVHIFDLHIISFWITVFCYHSTEYYYNSGLFEKNTLLTSLGICFVYFAGLILAGKYLFKAAAFQLHERLLSLQQVPKTTAMITLFFIQVLIVAIYFTYGFIFKSIESSQGTVSYFALSVLKLLPALVMALWAVFILNADLRFSRYNISFLLLFSPSFFVFIFLGGRRMLFYFLLLNIFIILERIRYKLRIRYMVILILALGAVYFLFDAYQSVRGNLRNTRVIEQTSEGSYKDKLENLQSVVEKKDEYTETATSLQTRPTPIKFLCDILDTTRRSERYSGGAIFTNSLVAAIPKVFYPKKETVLTPEEILAKELGMPSDDAPTTYLSDFFADYGYPGILFAILFVALIPTFLIFLNKLFPAPLTTLYCFGSIFLFLVQIEATITGFPCYIRDFFIFVVLDFLIMTLFPKLKTKKHVQQYYQSQLLTAKDLQRLAPQQPPNGHPDHPGSSDEPPDLPPKS